MKTVKLFKSDFIACTIENLNGTFLYLSDNISLTRDKLDIEVENYILERTNELIESGIPEGYSIKVIEIEPYSINHNVESNNCFMSRKISVALMPGQLPLD